MILWSLFWFRSGRCMLFSSWLPVSSFFAPLLSITDQSHGIKYDLISIDLREITAQKKKCGGGGNRENTTWVKHQWEWWGDGESHGVGGGGVGWWNAVAVSTFEEPVENVGTTSKEHHEIYNTPPPLLLLPLLWLQTLVPSGVVFLNWLFSAHVHRSSCETQAAGIQMAVFSSSHFLNFGFVGAVGFYLFFCFF